MSVRREASRSIARASFDQFWLGRGARWGGARAVAEHRFCVLRSEGGAPGYSEQLRALSKGRVDISSFVADGCYLEQVSAEEDRYAVEEGGTTVAYIRHTGTGGQRAVIPAGIGRLQTLVLGLDEGSVGAAGVAAAAFKMRATIWARFDKVHRIIRDTKLAEQHACGNKIFLKAKLWSTYLFGLNNRPFGSGVNYTKKRRLLELFEELESPASTVFMRYVSNIGREMGLPSDTTEEQSRIFQACCNLPSFTQKLEQPKVSNWFAWHTMAEKLIPEFYATKALYASLYPNERDPDD